MKPVFDSIDQGKRTNFLTMLAMGLLTTTPPSAQTKRAASTARRDEQRIVMTQVVTMVMIILLAVEYHAPKLERGERQS